MSSFDIMKHDLLCNYVDIQKRNASDIIMNCINKSVKKKKESADDIPDGIINTVRPIPLNTKEIVEGFTGDANNVGGVYNPNSDDHYPRGKMFCRNGQGCDYSTNHKYSYSGNQHNIPYNYCPGGTEFKGIDRKGDIVCSK